jgi:hypothetical protein
MERKNKDQKRNHAIQTVIQRINDTNINFWKDEENWQTAKLREREREHKLIKLELKSKIKQLILMKPIESSGNIFKLLLQ